MIKLIQKLYDIANKLKTKSIQRCINAQLSADQALVKATYTHGVVTSKITDRKVAIEALG